MGGRDYLFSNLKNKNHPGGCAEKNGRKLQWEVPKEAIAVIWVRDNGTLN